MQLCKIFTLVTLFYFHFRILVIAALHLLEALVAVYKCQKLRLNLMPTVGWVLQTVLFGIFSLRMLLWPQKPAPQQQQQQQQSKANNAGKQNKQQGKSGKAAKSKKEK